MPVTTSAAATDVPGEIAHHADATRRDFLMLVAGALSAGGAAAVARVCLDSMTRLPT
jgi:Ubiquitinol-cytochrome C reductase Fe-S subunit TAT signal